MDKPTSAAPTAQPTMAPCAATHDVQFNTADLGSTVWEAMFRPAESSLLPGRDPSTPAAQQGMFQKFDVRRVDGNDQPGGKHYGCRYFVLDLNHDQHAPAVMRAYADACRSTHPQLAADIEAEFGPTAPSAEQVRDAAMFNRLVADCVAVPCRFPSLRDSLSAWIRTTASNLEKGDA